VYIYILNFYGNLNTSFGIRIFAELTGVIFSKGARSTKLCV